MSRTIIAPRNGVHIAAAAVAAREQRKAYLGHGAIRVELLGRDVTSLSELSFPSLMSRLHYQNNFSVSLPPSRQEIDWDRWVGVSGRWVASLWMNAGGSEIEERKRNCATTTGTVWEVS